jgi:ribosomal protein L31
MKMKMKVNCDNCVSRLELASGIGSMECVNVNVNVDIKKKCHIQN